MRAGLGLLCLAYVLSQFFRAFLAVLSPLLERDIGARPDDLAFASGLWFIAFAAMQLPVGWALDRIGPRRTASVLLLVGGGGGAAVFALAQGPAHINIAMLLIGVGCSPVLMASYYIFARQFAPARFATLAALMLGVGSVGNLVASYPMALAAETMGWRAALGGLALVSAAVAVGLAVFVRDPPAAEGDTKGSLLDLLRMPALWAIFPLMFVGYAPSAAVRGLWMGPYLGDVFALSTAQIGQATLVMGVAMICGTLCYGPLDRIFGTHKWVIFTGNLFAAGAALALAAVVGQGVVLSIALCAAMGFFGASFPVLIAHARTFFPAHLAGRGVTLLNLFGIGGVGVAQFVSGPVHAAGQAAGDPVAGYVLLFGFFGLVHLAGTLIYLASRDNRS
ncbi:Predicted arabinose efflux permease, MFS family [Roseovarius litoreus]|uniref:Predicted arabinose efflux permease, MFS family n=1 Tax=Roseovarius litoreus TaxID=1155722 RepID=A0A1M7AEA7_9RHOB|nr:MFS transporter [Roseovarius litoreus]SHL40936.1 Predicted arabinose efflux permease, MFS family [Roseovarius litoreus]